MNRNEFVNATSRLSKTELTVIANDIRNNVIKFFPNSMSQLYHSLDDETVCQERYINTSYGKSHVFFVRSKDISPLASSVIMNFHGGGWCLPHGGRDLFLSRRLAKRLNCLVIDVDYVLAPENPYPAALEEIEALLNKLPELLPEYGADSSKVILLGQSAGGNLIGAVTQRKKYSDQIRILAQILCYPPTELYEDPYHGEELPESAFRTEYYGCLYNNSLAERKRSDISLVYVSADEMKNLPTTEIIVCGKDTLCAEGTEYYQVLKDGGVNVNYHCFIESRHGFLVNIYDEWQECEKYIVEKIKIIQSDSAQ